MNQQVDKTPQIAFQAHPKERGLRPPTALFCGCSCCCCCCLHTLGGLIGAELEINDPEKVPSLVGEADAGLIYWAVLAGLTIAPIVLAPSKGMILAIVILPILQLLASAITYIYLRANGGAGKARALRKLDRITKSAFIGGMIGAGIILVCIFLLSAL